MPSDTDIEGLALPFIVGMAVGLALGRTALDSVLLGVVVGLACFGLLAWGRQQLIP